MRKKIEKKTKKQNMSHYYWHSSLDHLGKQNKKKKSHLNKQTLEPNFYNDSVQIRKLTTICRRINRKSAVHSCLILSTKSSLTCFTTLYWQQLNIVRRMKFMKWNWWNEIDEMKVAKIGNCQNWKWFQYFLQKVIIIDELNWKLPAKIESCQN